MATSIPATILKESIDIYLVELTNINSSSQNECFPGQLKMAEIFPIFKKKDTLDKENHKHVSILSPMSKVFGRLIYKQFDNHMNDKLLSLLTGFRKHHSTRYCLLTILEKGNV